MAMYQPTGSAFGRALPDRRRSWHFLQLLSTRSAFWPIAGWRGAVKRAFDIVIALLGLIVLGVPMLVVAAIIRLESPGPALFRQRRIGFANVGFEMWKFRTMRQQTARPGGLRAGHAARHAGHAVRRHPASHLVR